MILLIILGISLVTGLSSIQNAFAGALDIDNDLANNMVGYWRVSVQDAGESVSGFITANRVGSADVIVESEVIFQYLTYVDTGSGGFLLSSTTSVSNSITGDDEITSSGSFIGSTGNTIDWTVVSSIAAGSPIMENVFTFTAQTGTLGNLQVFQYLDEDVEGFSDDVFFTRGSAASSDLELFTVDNFEVYGVSHSGALTGGQGLVNSGFDGWAADVFNNMNGRIIAGLQTVSPLGVIEAALAAVPINHAEVGPGFGPIDVVSTLAWTATSSASSAEVLTTLGGVPDVAMIQCGNGVQEGNEECDDGNGDNTDACLNTCVVASCGDTFVWLGVETCDPPDGTTCDAQCMTITAQCQIDSDCDDGQFCTLDSCVAGNCEFAQNPDPQCERVGGEFIGVDNSALLVAGFQANALWLLPAIAAIGIGVVVIRRIR